MLPRPTSHSKALGPGVAGPELAVATSALLAAPPGHAAHAPVSGAEPCALGPAALEALSAGAGRQHTQYPYVTGTSVLAIKYADGVMVAADMLGAYGSTKRYKSVERIKRVNEHVVVAAGGEVSDFQYIMKLLDELTTDDFRAQDGIVLGPREVYAYLTRVLYNRRNKFDPLWNSLVVAGVEPPSAAAADADAAPAPAAFLGMVGMIGTHYTDSNVTTGFANHLGRPLLRERQADDMSEADAAALLRDALRVCYYRDKASINKFQLAKVTKDGVTISEPFALDVKWDYKAFAEPTKWAVGAW